MPEMRIVEVFFRGGLRRTRTPLSLIDAQVRGTMTARVRTVEATRTVGDAVKMMADAKVGCAVVLGKDEKPVGIFTERDLVRRVADRGGAILGSPIARVMSKPLTVISPSATIWDAVTLMARADIRHLPVVEKGALVGILTERDVFRLILAQQNLLLESVSDSLPSVTRDQLRGLVGRYGLSTPPGKASS